MKWAILVAILMLSVIAFIPSSPISSSPVSHIPEKSPLPVQTPSNVSSSVQNPATSYTCYACGGANWRLMYGGSSYPGGSKMTDPLAGTCSICYSSIVFIVYNESIPYLIYMGLNERSGHIYDIYFYQTACFNSCINEPNNVTFQNITGDVGGSGYSAFATDVMDTWTDGPLYYPYHHYDAMILVSNFLPPNYPVQGWSEFLITAENTSFGTMGKLNIVEESSNVMPSAYNLFSPSEVFDPIAQEYVSLQETANNVTPVVYISSNGLAWTNITSHTGYLAKQMCNTNGIPVFDPRLGEVLIIGEGFNGCNTHPSDTITDMLNLTTLTLQNISASVGYTVGNAPYSASRVNLFTLHGVVIAGSGDFNGVNTAANQTWILGTKWINVTSLDFYHGSINNWQMPYGLGNPVYFNSTWQTDYPAINHNVALFEDSGIVSIGQWDDFNYYNSPPPKDVIGTSPTSTSISVTWINNVTYTSADSITWGQNDFNKCGFAYICSNTTDKAYSPISSFTISNLLPNTEYMIGITSYDVNFGSVVQWINVTTLNGPAPPNPGTAYDLQPIEVQTNQILMGWNIPNPVNDITDSYLFWWQYGKSVNKYPCSSQCGEIVLGNDANVGNSERLLATGLSSDTTYGFWVLLTDYGVFGNYSQITYVTTENTTQPPPPPPSCSVQTLNVTCIGQPYGLQLTNISFSSASFEWNLPSTYLTNVTLWWGSECGNWSSSTSLGGVYSTTTLSNLVDNQTYCVAVMPWDGAVHGFLSNGLTFSLGRPFNLAVLAQGSTWIQISWANPYVTKIVNDTVYYGTTCGYFINGVSYGWLGNYGTGGEATAFNLTKLKSGTTYCIAVQAWDGPSNLSNPVIDTTLGVASSGGGGGGGSSGGGGGGGIGRGTPIVLPGPNVCYSLPLVGCNWWLILAGLVIVVGGVQLYRGKRYGLLLIMGGIAIAILI